MRKKTVSVIINLAILTLLSGCIGPNPPNRPAEQIECERLREWLADRSEAGSFGQVETVAFLLSRDCNDAVEEMSFEQFQEQILYEAGCCSCRSHPLSKEWKEYKRLDCIWENLENERVRNIAFARFSRHFEFAPLEERRSPENGRPWAEITEPEKIKEILSLLYEAMRKANDRFANEGEVLTVSFRDQMQIVTDKHKYIIPVYFDKEITFGIGWTSYKLRKKLADWGLVKPISEQDYRILECVWAEIEGQNIRTIAFYQRGRKGKADTSSRNWNLWEEIVEPQKINEVLKQLRRALEKGDDRFVREGFIDEKGKTFEMVQMRIVGDRHQYIIPIFFNRGVVYGNGWTSDELGKTLANWGFPN